MAILNHREITCQFKIKSLWYRVKRSAFEKPVLKMSPESGILIPASWFMYPGSRKPEAGIREGESLSPLPVRPRHPYPTRFFPRVSCMYIRVCEKIYGISSLRFPNPDPWFWREETGKIGWGNGGWRDPSVRKKITCVLLLYTPKKSLLWGLLCLSEPDKHNWNLRRLFYKKMLCIKTHVPVSKAH